MKQFTNETERDRKENEIGNILRNARRKQKMTLKQLSEITGLDCSMLSRYENGATLPPDSKIQKIKEALKIEEDTVSKLINQEPEPDITRSSMPQTNLFMMYLVMDTVRKRANGYCELCGNAAPFDVYGVPYLEFYQINSKAASTINTENLVALCPTCHAKMHLAPSSEDNAKLELIKYKGDTIHFSAI